MAFKRSLPLALTASLPLLWLVASMTVASGQTPLDTPIGETPAPAPAQHPPTPMEDSRGAGTLTDEDGEALYLRACASCHGADGSGRDRAPSLVGVGAASVDFQLRTGRMPMADPDVQAVRKPPAFTPEQIASIVEHVEGFGPGGPPIPEVDLEGADLSNGQLLFVGNCAPCHGGTGNGGAAGERALAPSLRRSEPLDIAEAIVVGPGEMPHFDFADDDRDDVVAYVRFLMTHRPPGGASVGGVGPVPEGFLGWGLGVLVLMLICYVLGSKGAGGPRSGGPGSKEVGP